MCHSTWYAITIYYASLQNTLVGIEFLSYFFNRYYDLSMNVSVIGSVSPESYGESEGVGKSCLCNRLVRPAADDFYEEHKSLLSLSDHNSRVVNGDHFLFWGTTAFHFNGVSSALSVVEQTEFFLDETLRPSDSSQKYLKRAVATHLKGHDKLAYYSKLQLGFEEDYPMVHMPSDVFINAFIICYDVSSAQQSNRDIQDNNVKKLASELTKLSKPFIVAATKMDVVDVDLLSHLYDLVSNNRNFKHSVVVETSAKLNVNIEIAAMVIASLVQKPSCANKLRIPKYSEAFQRQQLKDRSLSDSYNRQLLSFAPKWTYTWENCETALVKSESYLAFVERFGRSEAKSIFLQHIELLKSQAANILIRQWLCDIPNVFTKLLQDMESLSEQLRSPQTQTDIEIREIFRLILPLLKAHPRFSIYFQPQELYRSFLNFPNENGSYLLEAIRKDQRIPVDILDSPQVYDLFKASFLKLKTSFVAKKMLNDLKITLEMDEEYEVGLRYEDSLEFISRKYDDVYDSLEEADLRQVFDEVQRGRVDSAKHDLKNLMEQFCSEIGADSCNFPEVTLEKTEKMLAHRERYRRCHRLPQLRTQILRDWLAASRKGDCRTCPCGSATNCMANRLRTSLSVKPQTAPRRFSVLLIGSVSDTTEIENISKTNSDGVIKIEPMRGCQYQYRMDFVKKIKIGSGDSTRTLQRADVLVFIVSDEESLQAASQSLQTASTSASIGNKVVCVSPSTLSSHTEIQAKCLAESYSADFINCKVEPIALSSCLTHYMRKSAHQMASSCSAKTSDCKIVVFCRCTDSFNVDIITGPLLRSSCVHVDQNGDLPMCANVVRQHMFLDSFKKTVQLVLVPYHARANNAVFHFVERVHGAILVFDPTNRQSYATMAEEANRRNGLPVFILAVDENGAIDTLYSNEPSRSILNDAASLAERLNAHFVKTNKDFSKQPAVYTPFIRHAYEKRDATEQLIQTNQLRRKERPLIVKEQNDHLNVNSLGRTRGTTTIKQTSSLTQLGSDSNKDKISGKKVPPPYQPPSADDWPIVNHPVDSDSGASLPISLLVRAIEKAGGYSTIGIYRVPGNVHLILPP